MNESGIKAVGGYIPRLRLSRKAIAEAHSWAVPSLRGLSKGSRAICGHDEDVITMAVAAASVCHARDESAVSSLLLASTSLPFVDRQNASLIAEALGLSEDLHTADIGGSQRAGTSALIQALQGHNQSSLVVASERRHCKPASTLEISSGDAAAAVQVGRDNVIAKFLGAHTISRDLVDHYRSQSTEFDYCLEERWIRDEGLLKIIPQTVSRLLNKIGVKADQIQRVIIPVNDLRTAQAVAKKCGLDPETAQDTLQESCGDSGCARPLLMLARALEIAEAGEKILVIGFGQGCDALLFETTQQISRIRDNKTIQAELDKGVADSNYLRYLSFNGLIDMDWGIRAERDTRTAHSAYYRRRDSLTAFVAGKCTACGTLQFPKTKICVNPQCQQMDTQIAESMRNKIGQIKSFTEDQLAYSLSPPFMYGSVRFENKAALMMEFADFNPGELTLGAKVQMAFRIKDRDELRGFHRYFWKAVPVAAK
jgi:3-hydroxy-3-methylglutaryl CoA synthase